MIIDNLCVGLCNFENSEKCEVCKDHCFFENKHVYRRTRQGSSMIVSLDDYQKIVMGMFPIYPNRKTLQGLCYTVLGLNGEAGEVAEKLKKIIRDEGGIYNDSFLKDIEKELGDVLWYLAAIADELGMSLSGIATKNIEKLKDRALRNQIQGSGDNR